MGTRSVYMDNANEPHNVIILKHFTEKNRAVVVDIKTRKRKTGSVTFLLYQRITDISLQFVMDTQKQMLTRPLSRSAEFEFHYCWVAWLSAHRLPHSACRSLPNCEVSAVIISIYSERDLENCWDHSVNWEVSEIGFWWRMKLLFLFQDMCSACVLSFTNLCLMF